MKLLFLFIPGFLFGQLQADFQLSIFDDGYSNPMQTIIINESNHLVMERAGTVYLNGNAIITRSPNTIGEGGMLSMLHQEIDGVHYLWIYSTESIEAVDLDGEVFEVRFGNISLYDLDLDDGSAVFIHDVLNDFLTFGFNHFGGSLLWFNDSLICTFGDNQQPGKAQNDDFLNGKVIRIDPFTGEGNTNNPQYNSNESFGVMSRTYAKGFRNPFRCVVVDSSTIGIADVGQSSFEEYTEITAGDNAGWWMKEGFIWQTTPQDITNEKQPAFAYSHDAADFQTVDGVISYPFNGVSIIGGVILDQFGHDQWLLFTDFFGDELLVANVQNNVLLAVDSLGYMPQAFNVHFTQFNGFVYVTNLADGNIYQIEYGGTLTDDEVVPKDLLLEKMYFNVLGQQVNPEPNMILIEVSKYENRTEVKKIIK